MDKERIIYLCQQYLDNSASENELSELEAILVDPDQDIILKDIFDSVYYNKIKHQNNGLVNNITKQNTFEYIVLQRQNKKSIKLWLRIAAAASIILMISFGALFLLNKQRPQRSSYYKNDILSGHNQAMLTLANGEKILVTKGLNKTLAQGNTAIQINNGVIYTPGLKDEAKQVTYNTLSTANGEQSPFPLILPDGSKVWLNAKSSITFPTAFNGKERIVKISGEAMFEVVHNAQHPFKVQTEKQTIEDIGTIFNVNAYADEPATKTTLVKGSVIINNLILKPSEQTDGSRIWTVNSEIYTAWKDGNFHFEDDNIQTIMRQLARWYDIDIIYQGKLNNEVFYADISRSRNLIAVLKLLENSKGVNFKVEGRRVTVIE